MDPKNTDPRFAAQDPLQLALFMNMVPLPPCGRRECPRQGVIKHGQYHCLVCNSVALIPPTLFDGFQTAILKDQKFLRQQDRRPDDSGTTGPKDPAL